MAACLLKEALYVRMYTLMYVYTHVCMHGMNDVCMYVCMYIHIHTYIHDVYDVCMYVYIYVCIPVATAPRWGESCAEGELSSRTVMIEEEGSTVCVCGGRGGAWGEG